MPATFADRVQHVGEQAPGGIVLEQAGAEPAQPRDLAAGIAEVEREQERPVDPATRVVARP